MPCVNKTIPDSNPALVRAPMLGALELAITAVLALVVSMRPLTAGQVASEPEATFIASLTWFAVFIWLLRKVLGLELSLVRAPMLAGVLVFAVFAALSVWRAWSDGNGQVAVDMGLDWAADLALLVVIADHCRERARFRLILSCLVAGLAAVAVYSLYQRGYGMEYFRGTLAANPRGMLSVTGNDKLQQRLYLSRVNSERVGGPFGYPNALAGYVLLLLPVVAGLLASVGRECRKRRIALFAMVGAGLFVIVLTGSKAGFLAAKAVEVGCLLLLLPRGQRWWARAWAVVAGVVLGTALALVLRGAFSGFGWQLAGQVVFAAAWVGEVLLLGRMLAAGRVPGAGIVIAGSACLVIGLCLCALLLLGSRFEPASKNKGLPARGAGVMVRISHLQQEVRKTVAVRANYWIAALRMARAYPLRGVGLDNFGSRYTGFKTVSGWAVKRAHNHYLQLAADGGVPLLLSFVLVWVLFFWCRTGVDCAESVEKECKNAATPENQRMQRQLLLLGLVVGIGAFILIYFMFLQGLFLGLSLEFFLNELNANPGTGAVRAETGSWMPAMIHGGIHLVLMPAAWVGAFVLAWKASAVTGSAAISRWLKLGVAGMLLHAIADFHLMNAAVGGTFWAASGLVLTGMGLPGLRLRLSRPIGMTAALVCVISGLIFINRIVLSQMKGAFSVRAAELGRDIYLNARHQDEREKAYKDALGNCEEAIKIRPRDSQLHRVRAELVFVELQNRLQRKIPREMRPEDASSRRKMLMRMLPRELKQQVLTGWRRVIACDPYFASGYEMYAQREITLYPDDRNRIADAVGFLEKACRLHPYKPQYRLELGELYSRLGHRSQALIMLRGALSLNRAVTDQRAKLTSGELRDAQFGIRYLEGGD